MIIGSGAEAVIERDGDIVRKIRRPKPYRHPELDARLRKARTRREAKVLAKLPVRAPALISMDDKKMVVSMEFVDAPQLRDVLSTENVALLGTRLGTMMRAVHEAGIIHQDLTTSNVLVKEDALVLIDFGLSFFSTRVEDRAVDLHVLKEAAHAKHPDVPLWDAFRAGYGASPVWGQLSVVERRGRYKQKGA